MKKRNVGDEEKIQGKMGEKKIWRRRLEKWKKELRKLSGKEIQKAKERNGNEGVENKLEEIEKMLKRKEKEDRKRNVVIDKVRWKKEVGER